MVRRVANRRANANLIKQSNRRLDDIQQTTKRNPKEKEKKKKIEMPPLDLIARLKQKRRPPKNETRRKKDSRRP